MQAMPTRSVLERPQNTGDLLQKLGRAGFAAKGVVYLLIGVLAAKAAIDGGGRLPGPPGAVQEIGAQPFGQVLLILIGVGLAGYAIWRMLAAVLDIEREGTGKQGLARRVGYGASALANAALAWTAIQLATGLGSSSGGVRSWAAQVMAEPYGAALVGLIGVGLVASGLMQIKQAVQREHVRELELSRMSANERTWVVRLGQLGLAARGVVFPIIGVALVKAALSHDPGRAKGIGEALRDIASSPFGMTMLFVVAVGLAAYGAYQVALARYRRMPAL